MSIPALVPSTNLHWDQYIDPYSRYRGPLEDFERGPVAVSDPTLGIDYQTWYLRWEDDESLPTYGDFIITAETTGDVVVIHNDTGVSDVGLAFDQNGRWFLTWIAECQAYYRWFDPQPGMIVTETMDASVNSVAACVDDHRPELLDTSDIILAYTRGGSIYWREERERFDTERLWQTGAGTGHLDVVGMNRIYRLQFSAGGTGAVYLSDIVGELCALVGLRANQINLNELSFTEVRGYISAGQYSAADTIRALQAVYFFDMTEIDGVIVAVPRGGASVVTIPHDDIVEGAELNYETWREQGVEFPRKLHLAYASAETDYTPTKVTSERRSPDVKAVSEVSVNSAVNHTSDDAAQRADLMHKTSWVELEGIAEWGLSEEYARLAPANAVTLEVDPGVFRRLRLEQQIFVEGVLEMRAVRDRASFGSLDTTITGPTIEPPTPPPSTIPGETTWEFMDLPALSINHDTLHYYVAGYGNSSAWYGAEIQRLVGTDWFAEGNITSPETLGQLADNDLEYGSRLVPDTTNTLLLAVGTPNRTPESISDAQLWASGGAWLVGDEIIQVRDWVAEGDNWRGSYLLRGRLDTTPVNHVLNERVVRLSIPSRITTDITLDDTTLTLRAQSYGATTSTPGDYLFTGQSATEWAPIDLVATQDAPTTDDWTFSWTPRYRLGGSASPIPSAHFYAWRLRITVGATTVMKTTVTTVPTYEYTAADQVVDFGSAQNSFTDVEIRALNYLGGEGRALSEAV